MYVYFTEFGNMTFYLKSYSHIVTSYIIRLLEKILTFCLILLYFGNMINGNTLMRRRLMLSMLSFAREQPPTPFYRSYLTNMAYP